MTNWFPTAWGVPVDRMPRTGPALGPNQAMANVLRNMTRCQLEMWAFSSRRAQAYMELPGRLARCKTPDAFAKEQARFIETAAHQYADSTKRLMSAWQGSYGLPQAGVKTPVATEAEVHSLPATSSKPAPEVAATKPVRMAPISAAVPEERRKVA